jgi:hypothetical protein
MRQFFSCRLASWYIGYRYPRRLHPPTDLLIIFARNYFTPMKRSLAAICCALAVAGCASSTDNTATAALPVATDSAVAGQPAVLR